ncbi:MAG: ABC transporter ATP-binding protein [Hespellia sp.]|nr:ABC transporter ATP-binding protein [Hespellia sp.]
MEKKTKRKEGIPRLFELAEAKKRKLTLACILAVISSGARIVSFFTIYGAVREVLQFYTQPQNMNLQQIYHYVMITLIGVLVYGLCAYASSSMAHVAAYDILYELRIKLMDKMSRISAGYFTSVTQGSIKKVMSDDVEEIEAFIAHNLCDLAAAIATPLFTLLYLFGLDWRLALVTLFPIIISIMLLGSCLKQKDKAALQVEMHDAMEKMTGTIVEYIHGMPVVKVFNRSLSAFRRYEEDLNGFVDVVGRTANANAAPMGLYYAFFGAQLLFLLPASIFIIGTASSYVDYLPIVLLFLLVGPGLKEPLENMMQMAIQSNRIAESVKRIDHILYEPEIQSTGKQIPDSYEVEFDHVSFCYGNEVNAIEDVSLKAGQGTINGIVGPSGSGKSTLVQLLLRFYENQSGCIRIGGVDIKDIPIEKLMDMVSYVFQDTILFHETIENNIRMGNAKASMAEVEEAAKNAGIDDVIRNLPEGYQTVVGDNHVYLSGGEKQRIAIARGFLKDSDIVILDEATAYADAENEAKIQRAFAALSKNKTVFIIAHRLKTIENADNIFVMEKGKLLAAGTHCKLMQTCDLYQNMVTANERRDAWTIKHEKEAM